MSSECSICEIFDYVGITKPDIPCKHSQTIREIPINMMIESIISIELFSLPPNSQERPNIYASIQVADNNFTRVHIRGNLNSAPQRMESVAFRIESGFLHDPLDLRNFLLLFYSATKNCLLKCHNLIEDNDDD